MSTTTQISRRAFTVAGSLVLAESCLGLRRQRALLAGEDPAAPRLRIGLMTDMHYADKKPAGTRHYRETLGKLERSAKQFSKDDLDMAIELGDFVDAAADTETELGYLRTIDQRFRQLSDQRHYVTLAAMVEGSGPENNAYATMDLFDDHVVRITGYCRQKSYRIHS